MLCFAVLVNKNVLVAVPGKNKHHLVRVLIDYLVDYRPLLCDCSEDGVKIVT